MGLTPYSFIFDLDGILWDGALTYALAWNNVVNKEKLENIRLRNVVEWVWIFEGVFCITPI